MGQIKKHKMQNILDDFPNKTQGDFLFILPIEKFTIHQKTKIDSLVIYPKGIVDIDKLFSNHVFLEDNLNERNKFKENSLIVFQSKSPVKFSAQPTNNRILINYAVEYTTPILDFIIFKYCNIFNNKTLPGRIGQIESGESILLMFDEIGSPLTRIISEKIYTNTITFGNGLNISDTEILNSYHLSNSDLNEIGNIAKHSLRMYTQTLESNSNTEKFIQIIRLFEFIASPDKYEKFQNVKAKIISHIAKNVHQIHEISDEFKYYSSGEQGDGLRTQIFHKGKKIEELVKETELKELFIKLHKYLFSCITDLLNKYNKEWAIIEQLRNDNRMAAKKNKTKVIDENYSSSIVLIDGNFLSKSIQRFQELYIDVYPDKKLDEINLAKLCYEILLNTRYWEENKIYGFMIFYSGISKFPYVKENFKDMDDKEIKIENINFEFHTFQTATSDDLVQSLNKALDEFSQNRKVIIDKLSIYENIIFCGDDKKYENTLNKLVENGTKEIILIRNTHDSEMNLPIKYFDVGHLVGKALGLKSNEL